MSALSATYSTIGGVASENDPIEILAAAVVREAIVELKNKYLKFLKSRRQRDYMEFREIAMYFRSDNFECISNLDGETLINKTMAIARSEYKKWMEEHPDGKEAQNDQL